MELDANKKCPVDVEGFIETGKQFDIAIELPEDERNVIYGIIKDHYGKPVRNAAVKLIEINYEKGEEIRKPISHSFTDQYGEFVFGPLCPDRKYAIDVWATRVKHVKCYAKCHHEGRCLKTMDDYPCDDAQNILPQLPGIQK